MGLLDFLGSSRKTEHKLKWPLPEIRYSFPLGNAGTTVEKLKRMKAVFLSGGQYKETVHAKDYGGAKAYFCVRTDERTQAESVVFDGYMLQEEDRLNLDLQSSYSMQKDLAELGYEPALEREVTEWNFGWPKLRIKVQEIAGLGVFLEAALPQTHFKKERADQQKSLEKLVEAMQLDAENMIPVDIITIQLGLQEQMQAYQEEMLKKAEGGAELEKEGKGEKEAKLELPEKGSPLFEGEKAENKEDGQGSRKTERGAKEEKKGKVGKKGKSLF